MHHPLFHRSREVGRVRPEVYSDKSPFLVRTLKKKSFWQQLEHLFSTHFIIDSSLLLPLEEIGMCCDISQPGSFCYQTISIYRLTILSNQHTNFTRCGFNHSFGPQMSPCP